MKFTPRSKEQKAKDTDFLNQQISKLKKSAKLGLEQYYPWFIVQKRFTPQQAANLLIQWLEYLVKTNSPLLKSLPSKSEIAFLKRALAMRSKGEEVTLEKVVKSGNFDFTDCIFNPIRIRDSTNSTPKLHVNKIQTITFLSSCRYYCNQQDFKRCPTT